MANKSTTKILFLIEPQIGPYSRILMVIRPLSLIHSDRIANLWHKKVSISVMAEMILGDAESKIEMFRIINNTMVVFPSLFGRIPDKRLLFRSWTFFNN